MIKDSIGRIIKSAKHHLDMAEEIIIRHEESGHEYLGLTRTILIEHNILMVRGLVKRIKEMKNAN